MDIDLQKQLYEFMKPLTPLPSINLPESIAENQAGVADNVLVGTKFELVHQGERAHADFYDSACVDFFPSVFCPTDSKGEETSALV